MERFHRTVALEVGPDALGDSAALSRFRNGYNWTRPHEALEMRVPGAVYMSATALARPRPDRLPEHEIAPGALIRKVDMCGKMGFGGVRYRPGRGLAGEWVEIRKEFRDDEDDDDVQTPRLAAYYAGVRIAALSNLAID